MLKKFREPKYQLQETGQENRVSHSKISQPISTDVTLASSSSQTISCHKSRSHLAEKTKFHLFSIFSNLFFNVRATLTTAGNLAKRSDFKFCWSEEKQFTFTIGVESTAWKLEKN